MFDRYEMRQAPNYPQTITVNKTEHRAPTDQSVSLLKEMQKEAFESLCGAWIMEAFNVKFVSFTLHSEGCLRLTNQIGITVEINGKKIVTTKSLNYNQTADLDTLVTIAGELLRELITRELRVKMNAEIAYQRIMGKA